MTPRTTSSRRSSRRRGLVVEAAAGRQLVEQSWRLTLDRWPCRRAVLLPLSPLIRIERIRVFDRFGAPEDLAAALYRAERASDPPRIVIESAAPEPGLAAQGIEIDIVVGGPAAGDVPPPLAQSVRMLVARWFESGPRPRAHPRDRDRGRPRRQDQSRPRHAAPEGADGSSLAPASVIPDARSAIQDPCPRTVRGGGSRIAAARLPG